MHHRIEFVLSVLRYRNGRAFFVFCCIAMALLLLLLVGEDARQSLRFSREEILTGEIWRVFTGHLVHLNNVHGLMNVLAFTLIMLVVGTTLKWLQWCVLGLVILLGISLSLLVFTPELEWYVGFSGVLHGLLVLGLVISGERLHLFALLVVAIKIAREQMPNFDVNHLQSWIGASVVVDAHLFGAVIGLVLGLLMVAGKRLRLYQQDKQNH